MTARRRALVALSGCANAAMLANLAPIMIRLSPKRVFDLVLALAALPFAIVLSLLAAIPIAIEARTSPFYMQRRLGFRQKPFWLLKLRTMHANTPEAASHEVGSSTILRSGVWIRKLKIDELPQLWNVVRGEMSLVGPRPGLPMQELLTRARQERSVYELIPGITGVAQVQGIDMSTPERLAEADAAYAHPWSIRRDLMLILATLRGRGHGDAARAR